MSDCARTPQIPIPPFFPKQKTTQILKARTFVLAVFISTDGSTNKGTWVQHNHGVE